MDRHTKEQRSYNMSQVKSKDTLPERLICNKLKERKFRFYKHYSLPGKPDIVFVKKKVAVFVDGEFWHGRRFSRWKNTLNEFWLKKIGDNIKRDRKIRKSLQDEGWKIIRLWDKDVIKNTERELKRIIKYLS